MVKASARPSWIAKFALGAGLFSATGQHNHQSPPQHHQNNDATTAVVAQHFPIFSSPTTLWAAVQPPINYVKKTLTPILEKMQKLFSWPATSKRISFKQIVEKQISSRAARWKKYKAPATLERMSLSDILSQRPIPKESAFFATGDCEGVAVVPAKICIFTPHRDIKEKELGAAIQTYKSATKCERPDSSGQYIEFCARLKQKIEDIKALNYDNADEEEYKRMLMLVWIASQSPSGELNTFTPHEDQWLLIRAQLARSQTATHTFQHNQYFPGVIDVTFEERKSGVLIHELCHVMLTSMAANKPETYKIINELYTKYKHKLLNLGKAGIVYGGYRSQVLKMENPHFTSGLKYLEENIGKPYTPYMTENIDEFFAVAVETWFDAPYFTLKDATGGYGRAFLNKEAMLKFIPELKDVLGNMFLPWTYSETELNAEAKKMNLKEYRPPATFLQPKKIKLNKYGLGHEIDPKYSGRHYKMDSYRSPPGNLEEKYKKIAHSP